MRSVACLVAVCIFNVSQAESRDRLLNTIRKVADEEGVPFRLLVSVCKVESGLNPATKTHFDGRKDPRTGLRRYSPSHGLCQIKMATARFMGFTGDEKSLYNIDTNSRYAAKYLRFHLDQYDGDWVMAVAAYNRGSSGVTISNTLYVKKVFDTAIHDF